jgi:DNA-binding IclR family transcriptional regulator
MVEYESFDVLDLLKEHPQGLTLDQVATLYGKGRTATRNRLYCLLRMDYVIHRTEVTPPLWVPKDADR